MIGSRVVFGGSDKWRVLDSIVGDDGTIQLWDKTEKEQGVHTWARIEDIEKFKGLDVECKVRQSSVFVCCHSGEEHVKTAFHKNHFILTSSDDGYMKCMKQCLMIGTLGGAVIHFESELEARDWAKKVDKMVEDLNSQLNLHPVSKDSITYKELQRFIDSCDDNRLTREEILESLCLMSAHTGRELYVKCIDTSGAKNLTLSQVYKVSVEGPDKFKLVDFDTFFSKTHFVRCNSKGENI